MRTLSEEASGLRHLRWAREILGTLEVHYEHNPRLSSTERDLVLEEIVKLRGCIKALSAAVKAYRDFLERERTRFRGMKRMGQFLVDSAPNPEACNEAVAIQEGFDEALRAMEARDRVPRKEALRKAVADLRAALGRMNWRLLDELPTAFLDSLYPELTAGDTMVLDDGDGDDDAAGA